MNYGTRLKELREHNGLSRNQLAEQLGITPSMIGQIERGTKQVSMGMAAQIAEIYNVDIRELFLA